MKVKIQDKEALYALPLSCLRSYLKSRGWRDDGPWGGGRATLYLKEHDGQTLDILLPARDTMDGYARSMAEAVSTLSSVEDRSELDVYYDIIDEDNQPRLDESITAHVVGLERDPEEFDGRATILYVQDGRPLRVKVKFAQPVYGVVIKAFDQRVPISVDGDIYRSGESYELRRPHNLSLLTE